MSEYRFILEKGKRKFHCPSCGKKTFVRYIDINTGNHLPDEYGRCDRESKCMYHLSPYNDGYVKMINDKERGEHSGVWKPQRPMYTFKPIVEPQLSFIPKEVLNITLQTERYDKNVFIQNLLNRVPYPFDIAEVERVISLYHLGTVSNGYRAGAITFPFIDKAENVRAIQVKQFDEMNHTTGTDFLHTIIEKHHQNKKEALPEWLEAYKKNDKIVSCLFGERLLNKYPQNTIALVEAPKTAIYGTLYFGFPNRPENLLWLAVYNLSSLSFEKCKVLKGRNVVLFPDLSKDGKAFELWSNKAKEFSELIQGTQFKVSDLLETLAPKELKEQGADIADVLIKMDWRKFRNIQIEQRVEPLQESEKGENSEPQKNNLFLHIEKKHSTQLQYLIGKNNALLSLINAFGLVEVRASQTQIPVENLTKPNILEPQTKEVLQQLAITIIGECNHVHKDTLPNFQQLKELGFITEALPLQGYYYLKTSTPF